MPSGSTLDGALSAASAAIAELERHFPGEASGRQPIHTVYGGAHLFAADTLKKLNAMALKSIEDYAPNLNTFTNAFGITDSPLAEAVYHRLLSVLKAGCVQDFRIDFEDGFGYRSDDEEDKAAIAAAEMTDRASREQQLPRSFGIRIKPLNAKCGGRAIRTLELFLDTWVKRSGATAVPKGFLIALPKVMVVEQVSALCDILQTLETRFGLDTGTLCIEMLVEHPQVFCNAEGRCILPELVAAARGRCRGAHFGAYDYTSLCGISGCSQRLDHPACDWVRHMMQVSLAQTGVWLSDGATNQMPIPPHRGASSLSIAQMEENTIAVHSAWQAHFKNVSRALDQGFYQGWDLHPAQIPARYVALYVFFLHSLHEMTVRLRAFASNAARATLSGTAFDDLATGQGLVNFFLRAFDCGAISEADLQATGLSLEQLRTRNFIHQPAPAQDQK
jgi:citrate lyase beta subunit